MKLSGSVLDHLLGGLHSVVGAARGSPGSGDSADTVALWLPHFRCGADQTVQGGAQGGEGSEAGERPDQAAPVCAGPGHLCGGLAEHHVPLGGGGAPGQEEAGTHHPCHAATVSPLLVGLWALRMDMRQAEGWASFSSASVSAGTTHRAFVLGILS